MSRRFAVLGGLALATGAGAQPASEVGPLVSSLGVGTHRFATYRFVSVDGERKYRVEVAIPNRLPPNGGYPSLWLCDGNAAFMALTAAQVEKEPDLALVALGYDAEVRFDLRSRNYDYTPAVNGEGTVDEVKREWRAGGADVFLALLQKEVWRTLSADIALDETRRGLWGHSYGGLFVLHTLYRHPSLFTAYVAASPSLWWYEGSAFAAPPLHSDARPVLLMTGDAESHKREIPGRQLPSPDQTVAEIRATAARLSTLHKVQTLVLPGLGHGAMFKASLEAALPFASRSL
ncbi:alpha/beta hydrolase-fold protein [Asticcacaulis sp. BYS171W]|uniref:Alpha/beta hydrolase-fold protein n=1 Tax=Asticcacaulis aquaticus TaxID=2984212 RepID=A0ABT5HWL0_9CAUL|nr:alpha/beta hydrolase-fold protein [Asticcacaulis aquaticus]MDC7684461.1 alpha/beta hydrolase-fold protein [Asticcacaulis aquaticus]